MTRDTGTKRCTAAWYVLLLQRRVYHLNTPERACGLFPILTITCCMAQVPLTQLLPQDIGAAAAYEAYRMWKHNSFLYEPLSADRERQREGLIGTAIAEST